MALAQLLADIEQQGGYEGVGPEPIVGLEAFFDGNDDPGSIGGNLVDHPGIATFHQVLRTIRDRPEVHRVYVGVSEVMPDGEWPFSDHVYVVTHASPAQVAAWAADLQTEEPGQGWWNDVPPRRPVPQPPGTEVVTLWWD